MKTFLVIVVLFALTACTPRYDAGFQRWYQNATPEERREYAELEVLRSQADRNRAAADLDDLTPFMQWANRPRPTPVIPLPPQRSIENQLHDFRTPRIGGTTCNMIGNYLYCN